MTSITDGEENVDDLIFSFLLQLEYPRASIVFDVDLLGPTPQVGSGMKVPTFVIVDPETADPLAVIEVVDNADADSLKELATETGAYASRLAGMLIQGFVIHVNVNASSEEEQVQFYRIWPNSTLSQLSSKNFPDFSSLQVARKLAYRSAARALDSSIPAANQLVSSIESTNTETDTIKAAGAGLYLPALALLLLIVVDATFNTLKGHSLLTLPYSVLAVGVAALLTLPAAIRYARH